MTPKHVIKAKIFKNVGVHRGLLWVRELLAHSKMLESAANSPLCPPCPLFRHRFLKWCNANQEWDVMKTWGFVSGMYAMTWWCDAQKILIYILITWCVVFPNLTKEKDWLYKNQWATKVKKGKHGMCYKNAIVLTWKDEGMIKKLKFGIRFCLSCKLGFS